MAQRPIATASLVPWAHLADLWDTIREHAAAGDLLVSGHNPQLSMFTAGLLGARGDALWMKKSALAALDLGWPGPEPRAHLLWLLTYGSLKG